MINELKKLAKQAKSNGQFVVCIEPKELLLLIKHVQEFGKALKVAHKCLDGHTSFETWEQIESAINNYEELVK